jgi:hypothetical protein
MGAQATMEPHSRADTGVPSQEKGIEAWYYTQQERNAGVMRPVQQLGPRPPVEAFAAAGTLLLLFLCDSDARPTFLHTALVAALSA